MRTAFAFSFWQGNLNEIVAYLNIVTGDLITLSACVDLSANDLWHRYRLLVRTAFNEFYRVKAISDTFLKDLKRLDLIDEGIRQGISQIIRDFLKPLTEVRNQAVHKDLRVRDDELSAYGIAVLVSAGKALVSTETGEVVQPSSEIGNIAAKVGNDLREAGRETFGALQRLNEFLEKEIADAVLAGSKKASGK